MEEEEERTQMKHTDILNTNPLDRVLIKNDEESYQKRIDELLEFLQTNMIDKVGNFYPMLKEGQLVQLTENLLSPSYYDPKTLSVTREIDVQRGEILLYLGTIKPFQDNVEHPSSIYARLLGRTYDYSHIDTLKRNFGFKDLTDNFLNEMPVWLYEERKIFFPLKTSSFNPLTSSFSSL